MLYHYSCDGISMRLPYLFSTREFNIVGDILYLLVFLQIKHSNFGHSSTQLIEIKIAAFLIQRDKRLVTPFCKSCIILNWMKSQDLSCSRRETINRGLFSQSAGSGEHKGISRRCLHRDFCHERKLCLTQEKGQACPISVLRDVIKKLRKVRVPSASSISLRRRFFTSGVKEKRT